MKYLSSGRYKQLTEQLLEEQRTGGDPSAFVQAIRTEYSEDNPRLFELWRKELSRHQNQNWNIINDLLLGDPSMTASEAKGMVKSFGELEYLIELLQDQPKPEPEPEPEPLRVNKQNYFSRYEELLGELGDTAKAFEQTEKEYRETVGAGLYGSWKTFRKAFAAYREERNQR